MMNQLSSDDHKVRAYEVANRTATKVVDASDYRHVLKIDNDTEAVGPDDTTGADIWWAATETTPARDVNVRDTAGVYEWNAGDGGDSDYFLRLVVGGAVPNATLKTAASTERPWPDEVIANDIVLTRVASVMGMSPGEWAWGRAAGDGDIPDTIYLRLSDSTDPDDKADNYVKARWVTDRMERLSAGSKHMQDGSGTVVAPIWIYQRSGATMWPKVCARTV
jgi:hypothetical protein